MKIIYQLLLCIAFVSIGLFFYCYTGSGTQNTNVVNLDAYNQKGVQENLFDFENLTQSKNIDLKNYKKFKFRYTYNLNIKGIVDIATLKIPMPNNEIEKQHITDFKITPKPDRIYLVDENLIAEYKLKNLKAGKFTIAMEGIANVKRYDIFEAKKLNKNISGEIDVERYLVAEKFIESNSPYIQKIANKIKGSTKEELVSNIFNYVNRNLNYSYSSGSPSAIKAFETKQGICGEFSAAMVALCRAKGIPARIVTGNIARQENNKHTWVEVYFDEYGWVTYEPTFTTYRNTMENGMLIDTAETDAKQLNLNYIAAIRNDFTPWYITYTSIEAGHAGHITMTDKNDIKVIK